MTARQALSWPVRAVVIVLGLAFSILIGLPGRLLVRLERLLVRHVAYVFVKLARKVAGEPTWHAKDWAIGIPPPSHDHPEYRAPGSSLRDELPTEDKAWVDRMSTLFAAFDNPAKVEVTRKALDANDEEKRDLAAVWLTARDAFNAMRDSPDPVMVRVKQPLTCPDCSAQIGMFGMAQEDERHAAWEDHIRVCPETRIGCSRCFEFTCKQSEKEKADAHDLTCPKSAAVARIRELEAALASR